MAMLLVMLLLYVASIILGLVCILIAAVAWLRLVFELAWLEGEEAAIVQLGVFMPVIVIAVAITILGKYQYVQKNKEEVLIMGWSGGNFLIRYKGGNPEEFLKLAKMLIPNSIKIFDFDDCSKTVDSVELQCTRNLNWCSADEDMKRLLSYFPDGDSVSVRIDSVYDHEQVLIRKMNNEVIFENTMEKSVRYYHADKNMGILRMLFEAHSPGVVQDDGESVNVCTMDGYVQQIANIFAGDEKLMPIVQCFMYEVLDKDRINSFAWSETEMLREEDCIKMEQLRSNFATVASTKQFLKQRYRADLSFPSNKKQRVEFLPDWLQLLPKSKINALGGAFFISQFIQNRGEDVLKESITMLRKYGAF